MKYHADATKAQSSNRVVMTESRIKDLIRVRHVGLAATAAARSARLFIGVWWFGIGLAAYANTPQLSEP